MTGTTGFIAVSGEDAGTVGPKLLEQVVRMIPEAMDFSKANPKKFDFAKRYAAYHDFTICLPKWSPGGKDAVAPGCAFDKLGIRLLDWIEANGYQLVTASGDLCNTTSIFRKV